MKVIATSGLVLSFLLPFLLAYSFIMNFFFDAGALFLDAGWFADLMWRKNWKLPNPGVVLVSPEGYPASFYGIHFTPMLTLVSQISWLLPLDRVGVFATFIGLSHGLMGLVMYRILIRWRCPTDAPWIAVATVLSVGFALNGLALSITNYPHYEILVPSLFLLVLWLMLQKRLLAAWLIGMLALWIREDVGFHFVAVLGLLIVYRRLRGHSFRLQKELLVFSAFCLAYSMAALTLPTYLYPTLKTFQWVYAGRPPFAHLTPDLILHRLIFLVDERPYVWLPLGGILLSAAILRSGYVAIGAVAFLPWLGLQLSAAHNGPGTLSIHYPYPLILGIGWVAIAFSRYSNIRQPSRRHYLAAACFGVVVASTFVSNQTLGNFLRNSFPREFAWRPQPSINFANALGESTQFLGNMRADTAIISLAPSAFSPTNWLRPQEWDDRKPDSNVDTIVYFKHGFESEKIVTQKAAMRQAIPYLVPGTNIRLATTFPIDPRAPIAPLLQAEPYVLEGFFEREAVVTRARTQSPTIRIFQCAARTVRFELIGFAIWPVDPPLAMQSSLPVRIWVNGGSYEHLEFSRENQRRVVVLPVKCVGHAMTVTLEYDQLIVPRDVTDRPASQALGIGIMGEIDFDLSP